MLTSSGNMAKDDSKWSDPGSSALKIFCAKVSGAGDGVLDLSRKEDKR